MRRFSSPPLDSALRTSTRARSAHPSGTRQSGNPQRARDNPGRKHGGCSDAGDDQCPPRFGLSRQTNIVQGKCKEFKRLTRQLRLPRWEASGLSCSRRSRPIYPFERHEALIGTGRASRPVRQTGLHPTGRGPATSILTRAETLGSLGGELRGLQ